MIVTQEHVLELLKANPSWANWFPYIQGLTFQETQVRRVKEKHTAALSFTIFKQMERCERDNGNDFAMDVWRVAAAELSRMGWRYEGVAKFGPRGGLKVKWKFSPVGTWKRVYRMASLKAEKDRAKAIGPVMQNVVDDLFQKRQQEAFS